MAGGGGGRKPFEMPIRGGGRGCGNWEDKPCSRLTSLNFILGVRTSSGRTGAGDLLGVVGFFLHLPGRPYPPTSPFCHSPLSPPPPHPTCQALDRLMDLEADLSGFGADTDADRGHLRLAAAKALLRWVWVRCG